MLNVVKRSGSIEPFSADKVKTVLAAASDEANAPMSTSALDNIVLELSQMLEGKQQVTTRQIYVMLVGILYTRGDYDTAKRYRGYEHNRWKAT